MQLFVKLLSNDISPFNVVAFITVCYKQADNIATVATKANMFKFSITPNYAAFTCPVFHKWS